MSRWCVSQQIIFQGRLFQLTYLNRHILFVPTLVTHISMTCISPIHISMANFSVTGISSIIWATHISTICFLVMHISKTHILMACILMTHIRMEYISKTSKPFEYQWHLCYVTFNTNISEIYLSDQYLRTHISVTGLSGIYFIIEYFDRWIEKISLAVIETVF
jgi:hypothetical protein